MDFTAEIIDGVAVVKPIIEKKGKDVIIHIPSFPLMEELKRQIGKGDTEINKEVFIKEETPINKDGIRHL